MNTDPLLDSFNRPVKYVRVSVTDRCNLRCLYCIPPDEFVNLAHEQIISYEEIERIVRVLAGRGVSSVRITGGEPLVRKHLERLLRALSEIPEISDLSLTTNGTLLADKASSLKAAGLSRVNVSLDTLREDRFRWITHRENTRANTKLSSVLGGIRAASGAGLTPVKINVVLMRGFNDDELMDFVTLTREEEYEVRFIEFMPMGRNGFWSADRVFTAHEAIARIKEEFELISLGKGRGSGPARRYQIPGHRGTLGFITPISSEFCVACNRVRLTSDGFLRTCLFSDAETDLLSLMRGGCSDLELLGAVKTALDTKPEGHHINDTGPVPSCSRTMSHIGG